MPIGRTRRAFLRAGAVGLALGVAGCARAPRGEPSADESAFPAVVRERARAVGETVRPAVVVLQTDDPPSSGTAWFLGDGHLVTNSHVIERLPGFACRTIDGRRFESEVLGRTDPDGPEPDVAVLATEFTPTATLAAGPSASLERGQPVVQVGHTYVGYWTIALGRFVKRVDRGGRPVILTEIPMMRGNSGSPLVTLDGDAVGLTVGTLPKPGRPPGADPTPGPPTVYERYPHRKTRYGVHVPVETVEEYVDRWARG